MGILLQRAPLLPVLKGEKSISLLRMCQSAHPGGPGHKDPHQNPQALASPLPLFGGKWTSSPVVATSE